MLTCGTNAKFPNVSLFAAIGSIADFFRFLQRGRTRRLSSRRGDFVRLFAHRREGLDAQSNNAAPKLLYGDAACSLWLDTRRRATHSFLPCSFWLSAWSRVVLRRSWEAYGKIGAFPDGFWEATVY
jgi:hypothetical protein